MPATEATRALTSGERALAASIFGDAIDYAPVTLNRRRWWPLQPRGICMAPDGHLWFHPTGDLWSEDFAQAGLSAQALFLHEMTHVWQAQRGGRWYLPLMRHPFCRYGYTLVPGKPFDRYGLEQQAEIVRHAFLARRSKNPAGAAYDPVLPFKPAYPPGICNLPPGGA